MGGVALTRKSNQHPLSWRIDRGSLLKGVSIEFFLLISRKVHPTSSSTDTHKSCHTRCPLTGKDILQSGDGGVQMSGVGWHWSHGSSELTISNRVTTVIKKAYLESATLTDTSNKLNITVQSRQLVFKRQQGLALFSKDVSILDPGTVASLQTHPRCCG